MASLWLFDIDGTLVDTAGAGMRSLQEAAVECFGADRLMIGSDWPVCTLAATYEQTMGLVTDLVADWPPADRDAVLGGNAARFWRLS